MSIHLLSMNHAKQVLSKLDSCSIYYYTAYIIVETLCIQFLIITYYKVSDASPSSFRTNYNNDRLLTFVLDPIHLNSSCLALLYDNKNDFWSWTYLQLGKFMGK